MQPDALHKRPLSELIAALALIGWEINKNNQAALRNPRMAGAYIDHASGAQARNIPAGEVEKALAVLNAYGFKGHVDSWVSISAVEVNEVFDLER